MIPDAEQQRDIDRIAAEPSGAALDASVPGAGKTLTALSAARARGANVILVVAPLGTRLGWSATISRMGWDIPFYWIRNHKTGAQAMGRLQFGEPGVYFIGPEYATTIAWDQVYNKDGSPARTSGGKRIKKRNTFWTSVSPDMLIVDEIHFGNTDTTTQRHKTYLQMQAGFILGLSGTPAGNRWEGIYGVTKLLWPDLVPKDMRAFKTKFCKTEFDAFSWDHMKVVGEKNPGEYFASLPCVVRRNWEYEGIVDDQEVFVELSAQQRKAYSELERTMVTMIEGDPFVIEFPPTLRIRLRQATLGMFRIENDGSLGFAEDCRSPKLDELHRIMAEDFDGEPALVFTDSKRFAKVVAARTPDSELFSGDQSQKERDAIRERFLSGETKYLIMVIRAGSTGLDRLQESARNLVWLSHDDSRIANEQGRARIVRRGQGDLVRIRHILSPDTYDVEILSGQIKQAIEMNRSLRV